VASSGPAPTAPGLSCAEGSRAGHRTPGAGLTRAEQRGRIPSLTLCPRCWGCSLVASRRHVACRRPTAGLLGCERTLPAHFPFFIHQCPPVLLHRAALNPFIPQIYWAGRKVSSLQHRQPRQRRTCQSFPQLLLGKKRRQVGGGWERGISLLLSFSISLRH